MTKTLGIAGLAFVAVIGLTVWLHGNARYAEGMASCAAEANAKAAEAARESAKDLERIQNETDKMSSDIVNAELSRLGIMRRDSDY